MATAASTRTANVVDPTTYTDPYNSRSSHGPSQAASGAPTIPTTTTRPTGFARSRNIGCSLPTNAATATLWKASKGIMIGARVSCTTVIVAASSPGAAFRTTSDTRTG